MPRLILPLIAIVFVAALQQPAARAEVLRAETAAAPAGAVERHGPILLELFTSQGCSACPPADRLLASLAERDDLLVLSFHVAYWDHMGWADPFAIPMSARRQRGYARTMRSRSIYTPQLVVQGAAAAVGSDTARIDRLIADASPPVALEISREITGGERFVVTVPELRDVTVPLELWAVIYSRFEDGFVPSGENAGRTLHHAHVVRQAGVVSLVERTPAVVTVDRPDVEGADGVAMILQGRNLGPVVGTGKLKLK